MKRLLLLSAALSPAPLHAQENDAGRWRSEIIFLLAPKAGSSLPLSTEIDPVDNSEVSGAFVIKRKSKSGLTDFALETGFTSAPQLLDDNDETSSLYIKATLGDRYVPLPQLLRDLQGNAAAKATPDKIRPYVSYQFAKLYSGFLDMRTSDDHTATVGIRYRDIRSVMSATNEMGVYTELRAEVARVWSTDDSRDQIIPGVRAKLVSRPLACGIRMFGEARGDFMFYTNRPVATSGKDREDQRLRLTAGADLSELLKGLLKEPLLEVAVQYQKLWSNDQTAGHDRIFFAPTFTLTQAF